MVFKIPEFITRTINNHLRSTPMISTKPPLLESTVEKLRNKQLSDFTGPARSTIIIMSYNNKVSLSELRIAMEPKIVAGDTMTIKCQAITDAVPISLMREDTVLQSTDPNSAGYEPKFKSSFLSDGGSDIYTFEISDMTKGADDKAYKCDLPDKTSSKVITAQIFGKRVWCHFS